MSMQNYLVLTPDGMGSTYLQRLLTVYLNLAGYDYTNTHELLNGLELVDAGLKKNVSFAYTQSVEEIVNLLKANTSNIVSRVADYHIRNRQHQRSEDYVSFYKQCNEAFPVQIMCMRDPFEYALSWGIRNISGKLNVYSIRERIDTHPENINYTVDRHFFTQKLKNYSDYTYWCKDNFNITHIVNYNNLQSKADEVLRNITGLDCNFSELAGISIEDYNKVFYNASLYIQTSNKDLLPAKNLIKNILKLRSYQNELINARRLISVIPHKMNTLADKSKKVQNFNTLIEVYNNWAENRNDVETISLEQIKKQIHTENQLYESQNFK